MGVLVWVIRVCFSALSLNSPLAQCWKGWYWILADMFPQVWEQEMRAHAVLSAPILLKHTLTHTHTFSESFPTFFFFFWRKTRKKGWKWKRNKEGRLKIRWTKCKRMWKHVDWMLCSCCARVSVRNVIDHLKWHLLWKKMFVGTKVAHNGM